jgi:glycosyltransferase involved in cell wall biosynthesis
VNGQPTRARGEHPPLVSVVIPTRNRAHLLPATLRSALAQTLHDIEVLVVDNGSSDVTPSVVSSFVAIDPRVTGLRCDTRGLSAARNTGLAEAQARWVAFLDDDDLWTPDALEALVAGATNGSVAIAGRTWLFRSDSSDVTSAEVLASPASYAVRPWPPFPYRARVTITDLLWRPWFPINAAMFLTSAVRDSGGFDTDLRAAEDYDLWLRLAWRHWIPVIDHTVALYRQHEEQMIARRAVQSRETRRVVEHFLAAHPAARRQLGWRRTRQRLARLYREEAYEALLADDRRLAARSAWRSLCCWPGELKSLLYLSLSPTPGLFMRSRRLFLRKVE